MRFAEIVVTSSTSEETTDTVKEVARRCGKNPVVVQDFPTHWGFVANRVYFAMIREAQRVVDSGIASPDDEPADGGLLQLAGGPLRDAQGSGVGLEGLRGRAPAH